MVATNDNDVFYLPVKDVTYSVLTDTGEHDGTTAATDVKRLHYLPVREMADNC